MARRFNAHLSKAPPKRQVKEKRPTIVPSCKSKDARIRRALEIIQPGPPVRISEIAAALNLSASGFRHLFKKKVGMAPGHYLKVARLSRANQLLQDSFLRVKEITSLVGANDVSHFVRDYKKVYRETPSKTRRRQSSKKAA